MYFLPKYGNSWLRWYDFTVVIYAHKEQEEKLKLDNPNFPIQFEYH